MKNKKLTGRPNGDHIKNGILYHPVQKIWNGIVSVGSYTIEKVKKKGLKLGIFYKYPDGKYAVMVLTQEEIRDKSFQLHKKVINGKYGQPYEMYDFGWKPCEHNNCSPTVSDDYTWCSNCGSYINAKEDKEEKDIS